MDQHSQYEFFPMVGVAIPTGAMALQEDSFYLSGMQLLHVRFPNRYPCSATTRSFLLDFSSYIFLGGFHVIRQPLAFFIGVEQPLCFPKVYSRLEHSARLVVENMVETPHLDTC
jgi:hypothetical protein